MSWKSRISLTIAIVLACAYATCLWRILEKRPSALRHLNTVSHTPAYLSVEYEPFDVAIASWLESRLFEEFVFIFINLRTSKSLDYCKSLAAAAINEIHEEHTIYTKDIYRHNAGIIKTGIAHYLETVEE